MASLFPSNQRLVGLTTGFIDLEYTIGNVFCQVANLPKSWHGKALTGWREADLTCLIRAAVRQNACGDAGLRTQGFRGDMSGLICSAPFLAPRVAMGGLSP